MHVDLAASVLGFRVRRRQLGRLLDHGPGHVSPLRIANDDVAARRPAPDVEPHVLRIGLAEREDIVVAGRLADEHLPSVDIVDVPAERAFSPSHDYAPRTPRPTYIRMNMTSQSALPTSMPIPNRFALAVSPAATFAHAGRITPTCAPTSSSPSVSDVW